MKVFPGYSVCPQCEFYASERDESCPNCGALLRGPLKRLPPLLIPGGLLSLLFSLPALDVSQTLALPLVTLSLAAVALGVALRTRSSRRLSTADCLLAYERQTVERLREIELRKRELSVIEERAAGIPNRSQVERMLGIIAEHRGLLLQYQLRFTITKLKIDCLRWQNYCRFLAMSRSNPAAIAGSEKKAIQLKGAIGRACEELDEWSGIPAVTGTEVGQRLVLELEGVLGTYQDLYVALINEQALAVMRDLSPLREDASHGEASSRIEESKAVADALGREILRESLAQLEWEFDRIQAEIELR